MLMLSILLFGLSACTEPPDPPEDTDPVVPS